MIINRLIRKSTSRVTDLRRPAASPLPRVAAKATSSGGPDITASQRTYFAGLPCPTGGESNRATRRAEGAAGALQALFGVREENRARRCSPEGERAPGRWRERVSAVKSPERDAEQRGQISVMAGIPGLADIVNAETW